MIDAKILKNSVLLRFKTVAAFGNGAKVELTDAAVEEIIGAPPLGATAEEKAERVKQAKRVLKARKKLLECKEFDAIKQFQAAVKSNLLRQWCNPSFIDDGFYFVSNVQPVSGGDSPLNTAIRYVDDSRKLLPGMVESFILAKGQAMQAAKAKLGDAYRESDYPSDDELRRAFRFEYRIIQFDVPEGLPPELRAQEERKLKQAFANAEGQLMLVMREGLLEVLQRVKDKIKVGPDGQKKRFNDTLFVEFVDFMDTFKNKNILRDSELEALIDKAKAVYASVADGSGGDLAKAAQRVREIEPVRNKALAAFGDVAAAVEQSIKEMPSRKFNFDEGE